MADIETVDPSDAAYHAPENENWGELFELADAGGWDDTRGT
nr:hypothetical protein [Haloplanus natans]